MSETQTIRKSVVKQHHSGVSANTLYKERIIHLSLYILLIVGLFIGKDFYDTRFDRANSSANFVSEPLTIYSFRHDTTGSKGQGQKILNVIAKEGVYRFFHDDDFKLSKKLYLINDKHLCPENKLSEDCLLRFGNMGF